MNGAAPPLRKAKAGLGQIAVWGPGLLVMLADTDAGNVVTGAEAGAVWGYRLLPLLMLLIPMLYMVQELTVRLGVFTGRGFGELVRERFGRVWASAALLGLGAAVIGSLATEFTGVAGIGELYGVPRLWSLPLAVAALLAILGARAHRRVERAAIFVGLFELAFFVVAWAAHPSLSAVVKDAVDWPLGNRDFWFMTAAIIGAVFNPWMIFYQQSAVAEKKLGLGDLAAARLDTFFGATLTQGLTGAVLVAAAARLGGGGGGLDSVGAISKALTPTLGLGFGRLAFGAGVLGASLVAAIVASLALATGVAEVAGSRGTRPERAFQVVYAACVVGTAALVGFAPDLVGLNIAAQALNALLLPLMIGLLIALALTTLPAPARPSGLYLFALIALCGLVGLVGVVGGLAGAF